MRSTMRKTISFIIVSSIFLFGVAYLSLDKILARVIETYGTKALGVEVKVDNVWISPYLNNITITGLKVANTSEYNSSDVIRCDDISISYDLKSVFEPIMKIHTLSIKTPLIVYQAGQNGDNLTALKASAGKSSAHAEPKAAKSEEKRFMIDKLTVDNIFVKASWQKLISQDIALKNITFTDLGKPTSGVTAEEVAELVVGELIREASNSNIKALVKKLGDLKNVKESLDTLKTGVQGTPDKAVNTIEGVVNGLFGSEKK